MKRIINFIILLAILFGMTGCSNTPQEYFDITTLNTNLFSDFGARDFREMKNKKKENQLIVIRENALTRTKSYVEYIKKAQIPQMEQKIRDIKALHQTDDTKDMINASLDLFNYVVGEYKTDYVQIATLMDKDAPQEQIDKAISDMDAKCAPVLSNKKNKLFQLAMPYAKKNDLQVEFIQR